MVDELITCSTCRTKNDSHRTICLSCGRDLSVQTDETQTASEPFGKSLRTLAKNLNTPAKWTISGLFLIGSYFGLTWFFFGSSHPCGILEARQKPYVVNRYREDTIALQSMVIGPEQKVFDRSLRVLEDATPGANLAKQEAAVASLDGSTKRMNESSQRVLDAPKKAVHDLHEKIWNQYTPAACLWEGLAWNPNPYKGSPALRDILRAAE